MAYLAVDKVGIEKIFKHYPVRENNIWIDDYGHTDENWYSFEPDKGIILPFNTIFTLTGQKITFDDEPIKI